MSYKGDLSKPYLDRNRKNKRTKTRRNTSSIQLPDPRYNSNVLRISAEQRIQLEPPSDPPQRTSLCEKLKTFFGWGDRTNQRNMTPGRIHFPTHEGQNTAAVALSLVPSNSTNSTINLTPDEIFYRFPELDGSILELGFVLSWVVVFL